MENVIFNNAKDAKPMKSDDLKGKQIVFEKSVYEQSKKSNLLFTKNLDQSQNLGTGQITYIKPRPGEAPFLIVSFSNLTDNLGVMLGDLKEAKKATDKSPDPMMAVKKSNKITGYAINPNAKFAWDAEARSFMVKA